MLDFILVAIATGIVARLAKTKGYDPFLFGVGTAIVAIISAFLGGYILGFVGEFLGIIVGGVIVEESVRNMPTRPVAKKQVFCPQCGLEQDWQEDKLCERCKSALRK